jgi:anti-anti-sigma factor
MTKTPSPAQRLSRTARSPNARWDSRRKVVWLYGLQNSSAVPELCSAIARAIAFDEADILLDLSDATSIDRAVVEVIVLAREYLRKRSRSIALRSPAPSVRRVLVLCGLAELVAGSEGEDVNEAGDYQLIQPMASTA